RELVDLKNRADAFLIQTRRSLEEHGGKVSPDVRGRIESALSTLESNLKGEDKAAIEAAMKELEKASMELGKVVYEEAAKKAQAAGGAPGGEGDEAGAQGKKGGGGGDDVIDAEFKAKEE